MNAPEKVHWRDGSENGMILNNGESEACADGEEGDDGG